MKTVKEDREEPSLALALTDVRIACLMVDYRDEPEVRKMLIEKRHSLAAVHRERAAVLAEPPSEPPTETAPEPVPERPPARPLRLFGQPVV